MKFVIQPFKMMINDIRKDLDAFGTKNLKKLLQKCNI